MAMDPGMYTKAVSANAIDNNDGYTYRVYTTANGAKPADVKIPGTTDYKKAVTANDYDNGAQQILNGEITLGDNTKNKPNEYQKDYRQTITTYWDMLTGAPDAWTAGNNFMVDIAISGAGGSPSVRARDDAVPNETVDNGEFTIGKQSGPSNSDF